MRNHFLSKTQLQQQLQQLQTYKNITKFYKLFVVSYNQSDTFGVINISMKDYSLITTTE